ncbi:DNA repair endonuclease XPF [Seminavis robusta]|uniref:DNA repair endonuclease XPF n=1 Tax=Seminavis robusta TaxID=568900 RepID=A0A9N8HNM9_9STRA|nr:DNA repair endonuclease XPF [Seminavis robusta]|eukprot:Sro1232_g254700.1 DNA repair endonuclease XPF (1030) ;mRNA; f:15251-18826
MQNEGPSSDHAKSAKRKRLAPKDNKTNESDSMVPEGLLPSYLAEAFADLYGEDGLLVLGKGLGWLSLLAVFVRFYGDVKEGHVAASASGKKGDHAITNTSKPPLVVVLGLRDNEPKALVSVLESWGTPPQLMPKMITNETGLNTDRAVMYKQGGVFCVTSRILIVDLLNGTADAKDIDGLLVAHAERVVEESTEAFILRIFHSQKLAASSIVEKGEKSTDDNANATTGFVKAFTDAPDSLMSGFARVDKTLKALRVRQLYLYPRFQDAIRQELEAAPPHVDELHQELSPSMIGIQNAIAAAIQGCIRELKGSTNLLEWTNDDLSVENCVTTNFDQAIQRQLQNDWHRLKPQTKQIVQDLRTLRTLFQMLIQYDCVNFYKTLTAIRNMSAGSRNPSMWLLMPAADMLFRKAKERIFKVIEGKPTAKVPKPVAKLKPILEETPKWKLLKQVLGEIQQEEEARKKKRPENSNNLQQGPANVLVMVKDEKAVEAVRAYLVDGKSRRMMLLWLRYLEHVNDRSRSIADTKDMSAISEESRLLLEEEGRVRRMLFGRHGPSKKKAKQGATKDGKRKKQLNEVPDYVRKRRRIATEKSRGELTGGADDLERRAILDEAVERTEHEMGESANPSKDDDDENDDGVNDKYDDDNIMFSVSVPEELRIVVKSHASVDGDEATILLNDLRPSYVVLYDAEVAFIRALEIYSSLSSASREDPMRIFFLIFEASAEEKTFTKALEKEQNAFERLIHHKKTMPPPALQTLESQEMQQASAQGMVGGSYMNGALPLAFDTRQGKGKAKTNELRDIAVDVREFRSSLPSILHQGGMRIAPVTLTVGDFVLSSVHCVERKGISDLFGSFASGRLHDQVQAMCKYYKCPCLLIEFDGKKSFCLQNSNEMGVEIKMDSICSKMVLLTRKFPKLRILWSRSPHHTLDIFKELKSNHEEVNVEKAMEAGRSESLEAFCEEAGEDDEVNEIARTMLMRLPGVNVAIARKIIENCDSLAELGAMSRDELRKVAGPVAGQKLFTFFRQNIAAT